MVVKKKYMVKICMGSSCFARGNDLNLEYLESCVERGEIEAEIEIVGSRCENICAKGPNLIINDHVYNNVDLEQLKEILENE